MMLFKRRALSTSMTLPIVAACMIGAASQSASAQSASPALQSAGAFSTVLTTLNAGFFADGRSFTSVPGDPKPDQMGHGVWVRGNAGLFDVSSIATASNGSTSPIQTRSVFNGIQAGLDLGNYNLGASGINVVYGLSGGQVNIDAYALGATGTSIYSIPFFTGYVVVSKGAFSVEASIRHDFYSFSLTDTSLNLNTRVGGAATTGNISASYKYDIPTFFYIEPSAAFSVSQLSIDGYFVPGSANFFPASGIFKANPVDSDLGRAGLRIGRAFNIGEVVVDPFVAASVWHEFAGSNTATFSGSTFGGSGIIASGQTTRVGTFGQYSVGVSAALGKSGILIFARGDLRSGENVKGNNISAGMRYQF